MTVKININNHIADVRLNRPDKINALDEAMFLAIVEAAESLESNADVRCVVLSGEGKGFCAGLDTSNFNPDNKSGIFSVPVSRRTHGIAKDARLLKYD